MKSIFSCRGFTITMSSLLEQELLEHRICFKERDSDGILAAPVTINPTPFSKKAFNQALQLQPDFNLLVLRTVQNRPLLHEICEKLQGSDDFVGKLFNIYKNHPDIPKVINSAYCLNLVSIAIFRYSSRSIVPITWWRMSESIKSN